MFLRLQVAAVDAAHYRPARRRTCDGKSTGDRAGCSGGPFSESSPSESRSCRRHSQVKRPLGLSLYLAVASLPAWCAFLVWIRAAQQRSRTAAAGTWIASLVAVSGRGACNEPHARWPRHRPSVGSDAWIRREGRGWNDKVTRFQVAWAAAGFIWTASAIAGAVLGAQGATVIAMVVGEVQCLATVARGLLRARVIKDAGSRLDARARREWQLTDR